MLVEKMLHRCSRVQNVIDTAYNCIDFGDIDD
jgi:hypothetical protein